MFARLSGRVIPRLATQARCISSLNGNSSCFFVDSEDAVLTRDFIKDALYNSDKGYNRNKKVGVLDEPIDFGNLWGKWEFNKKIRVIYDVGIQF